MSRVRIVPFQAGHLDFMDVRQHELDEIGIERIAEVAAFSNAASVVISGQVVAIIGYFQHWEGVLEVFMFPSKDFPRYAKSVIKLIKRYMDRLASDMPTHRMHTTSWAEPGTDLWMKYLGFKCEGDLVNYTRNKITYRMWARYFGNG